MLARFSEAFLILRAHQYGLAVALTPLVLVAMNAVYALAAYPFGRLADRMSHTRLLAAAFVVLIAADLALAGANHRAWVWTGIALWGLHLGMSQGLLATMVANTAPAGLRGTAYGVFTLVTGMAVFGASVLAGLLWDCFGAAQTFITGAVFGALALAVLLRRGSSAHARFDQNPLR